MNKQKLKEQEQKIKRKIRELDKQEKEIEKKIKSSEEFKKLCNEEKKLYKEQDILNDEISEIKGDIRLKYLDENTSHISYMETDYDRRNIRQETINAIKRVLGIKNISLLGNKEIVEAVKKLINNSLSKNKELTNLEEKLDEVEDRLNEIDTKKEKLLEDNESDKLWNEGEALYRKLDEISEIKKCGVGKGKKKLEMLEKKEEAKRRFKNFRENIDKIDIAITKEDILNNLEEEDDE